VWERSSWAGRDNRAEHGVDRLQAISSFLVKCGKLGDSLANNPVYLFFFVQFGLFNIFFPVTTKNVHGLKWWQCLLAILFLSLFWVWFGLIFSTPPHVHHFGW
jgi:hypothetical protein